MTKYRLLIASALVPSEQQAIWLDPEVSDYGSIYEILNLHQPTPFSFKPVGEDIYSRKIDTPQLLGIL